MEDLCWDEQAPTITTRFDTPAGGRFIHPCENRTLTPREAAEFKVSQMILYFTEIKQLFVKLLGMQFHLRFHSF